MGCKKNLYGADFVNKAAGFDAPTQLPRDQSEHHAWQMANRAWWETSPMRYDWRREVTCEPGTRPYFEEIDRRFFASASSYSSWHDKPFATIIPFEHLAKWDVLEIGVGLGTHAQLLSPRCRSFTGIDLTSFATKMTSQRLRTFGLPGQILQMDAERMAFADASFDYIWSWGVIHHSADTSRVLGEMHRVLRRGGSASVMVYHRNPFTYRLHATLKGLFQGGFRRHSTLHKINQSGTDGAIARYYAEREWRDLTKDLFVTSSIQIYGMKSDVIPIPHGALKRLLESLMPDVAARLLTHNLRLGTFLVAHMNKI